MSAHFAPASEKINYVIDTSVLASNPESIHSFAGHNLYIPIEVLEELDNLKNKMDQTGAACRYVNRYLDQLRQKGNLSEGIELDNKQMIYVSSESNLKFLPESMPDTVDNRIISVALFLVSKGENATVVSKDISLRIRCDSLMISAVDFEKNTKVDYYYDGMEVIEVSKEEIEEFYAYGSLTLIQENLTLYPNQGVVLKSGKSSALAMAEDGFTVGKLRFAGEKGFIMEGIVPRSKEQTIACELLLDPDVNLITMVGSAGCGKTLLAIASAIKMLQEKKYKKIMISRPIQSTSKDIGFLPGDKKEKLSPWLQPIFDNIDVILNGKGKSYIDMMLDKGIIEMEALTYVRGRTLPNTIFIIDEAQNITHHEAKALLTRMGENSKIILIGDLEQIDSPTLTQDTSGLASVVNLFQEFEGAGHIRLKKCERSDLANFAAKVM